MTKKELELHSKAIVKLKQKLFETNTFIEYGFIEGSEAVVAPSVSSLFINGTEDRKLALGGLKFRYEAAGRNYAISVSHIIQDMFSVSVSLEDASGKSAHTLLSTNIPFRRLDDFIIHYIRHSRGMVEFMSVDNFLR